MRYRLTLAAALVGIMVASSPAVAGTIFCPGTASDSDREFSLTTTPDATCLAHGSGNLNGNNDPVNQLGYVTLDKSDDLLTGLEPGAMTLTPPTSGLSGTFSIDPLVAASFKNFVLALKPGGGGIQPQWAAFLLPAGVLSGDWAISGQQNLSHGLLYAQRCAPDDPDCGGDDGGTVPEPATLLLLGAGLVVAGARLRRRL